MKIGNIVLPLINIEYDFSSTGIQQIYFDKLFESKYVSYVIKRRIRDQLQTPLREFTRNYDEMMRVFYKTPRI